MNYDYLIIDGYNLLHTDPDLVECCATHLQEARHRLVRRIEKMAFQTAKHTIVVFDGQSAGEDSALSTGAIEVIFSPSNLTADSVIERLAERCPDPEKVLVVTSDRAEQTTVQSSGAQVFSSSEFMEHCFRVNRKTTSSIYRPTPKSKLGDFFPE